MEKKERAAAYFQQGYACSQSVLMAFADDYGLASELAARIASGFGAGIGRTGRTCGAVSGAVMVIGLAYGSASPDRAAKEAAYERVQTFLADFQRLHGSLDCNSLICADMATPEGRDMARATGKFTELCPVLVADAARIAAQILTERENQQPAG